MSTAGPGRPRLAAPRRPGRTTRAEILDAAAELFVSHGFSATSTRSIAEAVGIRQASLYHHFATKEHLLTALLADTVDAPNRVATQLLERSSDPADVRLYALCLFDAGHLNAGRWNLGALYLLPELRGEQFADFRGQRQVLRERYHRLASAALAELRPGPGDTATLLAELPFRIVESVIDVRSDADSPDPGQPVILPAQLVAETCLRAVGHAGPDTELCRQAQELLTELDVALP
ncbi:TetR/AcrR family transcriptional regulator [Rhodococcus sp. X156]|uniref:TetR/AcrR family transcriptional regulator n=1 Tax=Rhodococcus sp. X156 TaxID=2499145 RepID=UPI000FD8DC75|nr:TetR/AcrR family transcriptional regulator [Rhodococcus sp. X156]